MDHQEAIIKLRKFFVDKQLTEARDFCIHLIHQYPQDIELWKACADLHFQLNEYDSFSECCRRIIQLTNGVSSSPMMLDMHRLLANRSYQANQITNAMYFVKQIISAVPNDAEAHCFLAGCHLMLSDFDRGWPEFEWRLKTPSWRIPSMASPRWDGRSLDNKTILIIADQGYGDAIQFVRYVRYVKAQNGKVILVCRPQLNRLLSECAGIDHLVNVGDRAIINHDVHIMTMSLPNIFHLSLKAIPAEVPYLSIPLDAGMQAISEIVRHMGVFRVGLVWVSHGAVTNLSRQTKALKSLKLEQFRDLFNITGVKFFSLQKEDMAKELEGIDRNILVDLSPFLEDFADTAAAIQALDLVISIDTAVTHLAGALGKPVWTLLPFAPDWRWMLDREDSPWYPTMRLFRQPTPGDWASVIKRVATELTGMVQSSKQRKPSPSL